MIDDPYLIERLHRAMAEDPRVSEPNVKVHLAANRLWLTGHVGSDERRKAAEEVVREVAPGWQIHNDLDVLVIGGPTVELVEP